MKYTEIKIKTTTLGSEILGDVLQELTGEGVSVYDKKDLLDDTWDYKDDAVEKDFDREVILNGYVLSDRKDEVLPVLYERIREIKSLGMDIGSSEITLSEKESDTWRDVWKRYFKPIVLGNIVVCPEWIDYKNEENRIVLRIDPGFAFGTGEHETTSMVLKLMQTVEIRGKSVADIGCGSGILGIAAHLFGAKDVLLVDLDPQAVEASVANARLNGCEKDVKIVNADLLSAAEGSYDVVLANLTADILVHLADDITRCVREGTVLILSGILDTRLEETEKLYNGLGFMTEEITSDGEWMAIVMKKSRSEGSI